MRRMNNLVTLFTAMVGFFFGSFIMTMLISVEECPTQKSGISKLQPHPELFLIVLILTAPGNEENRQAMRDTWLQLGQSLTQPYFPEDYVFIPKFNEDGYLETESIQVQSNTLQTYSKWMAGLELKNINHTQRKIKIKHFFAIGTANLDGAMRSKIEREQRTFKDMLFLPRVHDAYKNLTEKLLHAIDAITHNYQFSYLLKVDDDTYVKLDHLLNELISYDRKLTRKTANYREQLVPELYWGYFNGRGRVHTTGKWKEPNYFVCSRYITYALGGGYLLSRKLCEFIASNSRVLISYSNEDISVGTWLAPLKFVYRRHDPRFDTMHFPRACQKYHLVLHKRSSTIMKDLYANKLCTFEADLSNKIGTYNLKEYFYDWTKTAEKCCDTKV